MSIRLFLRSPLLLILTAFVLLATLSFSPRPVQHRVLHRTLSSSSLFQDCKDLLELTLPSSTTRLDWLQGTRLKTLNASSTKITSLKGLPDSLRELDISNNKALESLRFVPQNLRSLDIRGTKVRDLQDLPPRLEVLKISGPSIRGLKSLGPHIRELYLEDVKVENLSDLPRNLKELHLAGRTFEHLKGIPPELRVLTLHGTRIGALKDLPPSLQKLELTAIFTDNPPRFEIEDLPERLTTLTIETGVGPFNLSDRKYLVRLSDLRDAPEDEERILPPFLSSVTLQVSVTHKEPSGLPKLPPSVCVLALKGATFSSLDNLPPGLKDLSLQSYTGPELGKLPLTLKRFSVEYTSLTKLPILPAELTELKIIQTEIVSLENAPTELQTLVFCQTQLKKVDGIRRFTGLKQLDLCESKSLAEIGPLPKGLKKLNINETSVNRLPNALDDLEELNISKTSIRLHSLQELSRKLKVLTLSDGQVVVWEGFPPGLQVLRFEGTVVEGAGKTP